MMNVWDLRLNPPEIKEIHKLHGLLSEAGIEHDYVDRSEQFDPDGYLKKRGIDHNWGWQVVVRDKDGERILSAIEGYGTYGVEYDLIEIMGLLTPEELKHDMVLGGCTAEEIFERIKKAEGVVYNENV